LRAALRRRALIAPSIPDEPRTWNPETGPR
jgi:hypothetical protein